MTPAQRLRRRATRGFYRALRATCRGLLPTGVGPGPVNPNDLRRIALLASYQVGDLVVALPALDYLRRAAPHARLDVVLSPRNASLVAGDPRVDGVLLHEPRREGWVGLARRLRRGRYDAVVDFVLPHHAREGVLTAWAAARRGARVTPYRPARYLGLFTHHPRVPGLDRRYMADRLLYAVAAAVRPLGAPPPDPDALRRAYPMRLPAHPESDAHAAAWLAETFGDAGPGGRPVVAVNAWARDPVRTLAVSQVRALLARLEAAHPEVAFVVTPPPGAEDAAAAMVEGTGAAVYPPAAALGPLVALLRRCAAVVTPDTANIHLAAAVGCPVVALFATAATANVAHWVPSGVPCRVVTIGDGRPLRDLAPEDAAAAFEALWAAVGPERAGEAAEPAAIGQRAP